MFDPGIYVPLLGLCLALSFVCGILWFLSLVGGWHSIAKLYPDKGQADVPDVKTFRFRSGGFGTVNYGSCLILGICSEGIRISVLAPFRVAHPPIFIPWSEFHGAGFHRFIFLRYFHAYVGQPIVGDVRLPSWVADFYPYPIKLR